MRRLLSLMLVLVPAFVPEVDDLRHEGTEWLEHALFGVQTGGAESAFALHLIAVAYLAVVSLLAGAVAKPGDGWAQWLLYIGILACLIYYVLLVNVLPGEFLLWFEENYPEASRRYAVTLALASALAIFLFYDLGQKLSRRIAPDASGQEART